MSIHRHAELDSASSRQPNRFRVKPGMTRIALVYDRVNKIGGAERLLLALHQIYPRAPLYTLVYNKKSAGWAKVFRVRTTFLNHFPFLRTNHELLAPVAGLAFETLDFSCFQLVISLTSSDAKAVITPPGTFHLCYCLTPTRYLWSGAKRYTRYPVLGIFLKLLINSLRRLDLHQSRRPDAYIAISKEVAHRIKRYYRQSAPVVYPPIDDKFLQSPPASSTKQDYFLVVSLLVPYKRVDLSIKACLKKNLPLVIIGTGSQTDSLKKISQAKPGLITFLGQVNDQELITHYHQARALIFPQHEDFGLTPLESQACGTPVIAYGRGGALETIIDQKTGLFFDHQTTASLCHTLDRFAKLKFNSADCRRQAKKFTQDSFRRHFSATLSTQKKNYVTNQYIT